MRLRFTFSLIVIASFSAVLVSCGGGSSSTGGSGGGSGFSSSLVVQASDVVAASDFRGALRDKAQLASKIANLLISEALAQAGENVYLLDSNGNHVSTGTTDGSGQVVFAVVPGNYYICINEPSLVTGVCSAVIGVGEEQVVAVTLGLNETELEITSAMAENAADQIVDFQDPSNANKTIVCHQTARGGRISISVSTDAILAGHRQHGDPLGYCDPTQEQIGGPPTGNPAGPSASVGPPEAAGPPETAGPPEGVGRPEGVGKPEGVGPPQA